MKTKWFSISALIFVGLCSFARAESEQEKVQIFSINGKELKSHPDMVHVLPGEQIAFQVDAVKLEGQDCAHPEGCPEGIDLDQFIWVADDSEQDHCDARDVEHCMEHSAFEPQGNEIIFHIPRAMDRDIVVRVARKGSSSEDKIVLRSARGYAEQEHYQPPVVNSNDPWEKSGLYNDSYATNLYPNGYWVYPSNYWWGPYPYYYSWGWGWWYPTWYFSAGVGWYGGYVGPAWRPAPKVVVRATPMISPRMPMREAPIFESPGYRGGLFRRFGR